MPFGYFDDLSADERSCDESSSVEFEEAEGAEDLLVEPTRMFVHADVDCFYCQCEHKDKQIDENQPLGIGQKHIIVTSNYAARAHGVGKLMMRDDALRKCPGLLIVEGSDLERYRNHSRHIYESFRNASLELLKNAASVRKGCMDEMALMYEVDYSLIAAKTTRTESRFEEARKLGVYVYGDSPNEMIRLTEDQTGAETIVREKVIRNRTDETLFQALLEAAILTAKIRQRILSETGFTVTMGVSTSPLLAKLASGLRKPHTVNILEPDRADTLIRSMPLRKITGIGRQTVKALQPTLEKHWQPRTGDWTCGDVLKIPKIDIVEALETMADVPSSSARDECDRLLDLCRGIDASLVVDDEGGAQKTLSVENSFRRGTVCTKEQVHKHMFDLYNRLPRLFEDRINWSAHKELAYPKTIRLTVRVVGEHLKRRGRRPFVTKSRQQPFDGRAFLKSTSEREKQLQEAVSPLLQPLLFSDRTIDLTRVNIALTNFQDTVCSMARTSTEMKASAKRRRIDDFFTTGTKA